MSENTRLFPDPTRMINAWTNSQRQLWQAWLETATGQRGWSPGDTLSRSMQHSGDLMDRLFSAQSECARLYCSTMRLAGGPVPNLWSEWWQQAEYLAEGWTSAQRRAAKAWLAAFEQLQARQAAELPKPHTGGIDAWWEAAARTWQIQNAWLKMLSTGGKRASAPAPEAAETEAEAPDDPAAAGVQRKSATRDAA